MPARRTWTTTGLLLTLAAVLIVLPACKKKKKETDDDSGPPGSTSTGGGGGGGGAPRAGLGLSRSFPGVFQTGKNNLTMIGLAFHNYHDANGFMPCGICGPDRKTAGLSWRVQILPYIEQDGLFRQFKLNEPWDSPHNKALIDKMPKVYAAPGGYTPAGYTYYRAFAGPGTAMPVPATGGVPGAPFRGLRMTNISDGLSNTGLVAEAAEPVIWTKPDELMFDPKGSPKVGGVFADGTSVLLGDGAVMFLQKTTPAEKWRALITAQGGEIVDLP